MRLANVTLQLQSHALQCTTAQPACSHTALPPYVAPAAVRIQFSNDGKNSWKFLGLKAGFALDMASNLAWANIKSHSDKLSFMHYPAGATCWAAGGLQDSTTTTMRNKMSPVPPICTTTSDPWLPRYPSGELSTCPCAQGAALKVMASPCIHT